MRILVTGSTGQVGFELCRALAPLGEIAAPSRAELDLARPESVRAYFRDRRFDWIVNAAAYTAVDRAEKERELALVINGVAPGILAEEAARQGAGLVHYSTDYVFDGSSERPYREDDPPAPLNVYGETKLAGERAVLAAGGNCLIFRTSWVYGARGSNFMRTILRLAHEREELTVVDDQVGAPTWSRMIAQATALIVAGLRSQGGQWPHVRGVYHLTAKGYASWHGFATEILALDPDRAGQRAQRIKAIPSSAYATPARRPANSRLDCTALTRTFGISLPDWRTSLEQALSA
jgi:dTDP-4-dehydrorhamnose reductase